MERIKNGDEEAMAHLYDLTSSLLFGFTMRIVGNPQDAEEVLMDVYAHVWRSAGRFDPRLSGVKRWLILIARSRAIDHIRKRNSWSKSVTSMDAGDSQHRELTLIKPGRGTEGSLLLMDWAESLGPALKRLPTEQRRVIELSFFSELSHTEIAAHLSVPLGTVKTRIRLGLQRLRQTLTKQRLLKHQ